MKTETIQRKPHPITGEVTTFEVPEGWADENADLMEEKGLKVIATPVKAEIPPVADKKNVEPVKSDKDGKETDKGK